MIPRGKPEKSKIANNTGASLLEQHWKKMAGITQKLDFLTWSIQNFIKKVKQFVTKYYITWLIDLANKLYDIDFLTSFYAMCY